MKKILWIDDDINRFSLMPYIDELSEKGFAIIKVDKPDEIEEKLLSNQDGLKCIIVDVSMPPGDKINFGEAKGGMQTGLVILKNLVKNTDLNNVKKVVFTIVDNADVREYCNEKQIPYLQKHKYFTDTFVAKIEEIITNQHITKGKNERRNK